MAGLTGGGSGGIERLPGGPIGWVRSNPGVVTLAVALIVAFSTLNAVTSKASGEIEDAFERARRGGGGGTGQLGQPGSSGGLGSGGLGLPEIGTGPGIGTDGEAEGTEGTEGTEDGGEKPQFNLIQTFPQAEDPQTTLPYKSETFDLAGLRELLMCVLYEGDDSSFKAYLEHPTTGVAFSLAAGEGEPAPAPLPGTDPNGPQPVMCATYEIQASEEYAYDWLVSADGSSSTWGVWVLGR